MRACIVTLLFFTSLSLYGQSISGVVTDASSGLPLPGALISMDEGSQRTATDLQGIFVLEDVPPGIHRLSISFLGMETMVLELETSPAMAPLSIALEAEEQLLDEVVVADKNQQSLSIQRLRQVEDFAIYAAKKNELIHLDQLTINKASNQSRQVYAKVSGLNIWESDGAGVQLGIGGRGLSPNRNSNFNTRQNGYDISADALGYPESYYTPPMEAIERIEIVRGAASLQYGTQFGGLINFRFEQGPEDKKISLQSRQTLGSFGFFNTFNSIGGTVGKVNYYSFYQYKKSDGWRPNESLDQHTGFVGLTWSPSKKLSIRPEYTHTQYLAQQPGGLTDAQFAEDPRRSFRERNWFAVNWNLLALNLDYRFNQRMRVNSRTFGLMAGRQALGNLDNINLIDFGQNRDLLSDRFRNWGNETRLIYQYQTGNRPHTFLLGTRYYQGLTLRQQGEGNDGNGPDFHYLNPDNLEGSDFRLPSRNFSAFAEHVFTLSEAWTVTPGLRFEYISTRSQGYYRQLNRDLAGNVIYDERIPEARENNRSFFFFGVGSSFRPNQTTELYANFSQNYRAINFNDIRVNVGSLQVDENLRDERGYNLDVGIRGQWQHGLEYDISIYHLSYNDRIGTILRKEPNPVFNGLTERLVRFRTNIADARIYGLESLLEWKIIQQHPSGFGLSVFSNISITHARYESSEIVAQEGKHVELVPPFMLRAGVHATWKDLSVNLQFSHTEEHFSDASNAVFTPTAIEGIIPSYQVMDLSGRYNWRQFELESGINNLLDARYFTRRATGYPGPGIIPSVGRSLYLTLGVQI